ncbi:unnamed protein product, partial [Symbiodinium necroappetens]
TNGNQPDSVALPYRPAFEAATRQLPVETDITEYFLAALPETGALLDAGVQPGTQAFLHTFMRHTWFCTDPQSERVYHTQVGTVPGAPLADLLFQYAAHAALLTIEHFMRVEHLAASILLGDGAVPSQPVTWLDDVALLVEAAVPSELGSRTARAASIARQCFQLIGISTNLEPGKTEALMIFKGRGSRAAAHEVMVTQNSTLQITGPHESPLRLRVTPRYVHLGTQRNVTGGAGEDLKRRAGLARVVYKPFRARLLRNECLSVAERMHMLLSMVLASFLHGVESWAFRVTGEFQAFRKQYMAFFRGAVRPLFGVSCRRMEDSQVCAMLGVSSAREELAIRRLRAFAQVCQRGSDFLRAALVQEQEWLLAVRDDAQLLASKLTMPAAVELSGPPTLAWFENWPLTSRAIANTLKAFRKRCIKDRDHLVGPALYSLRLQQIAEDYSLQQLKPTEVWPDLGDDGEDYPCGICSNPLRLRQRQVNPRCADTVIASDIDATTTDGIATGDGHLPVVPLVGPQPFWATLRPPPEESGFNTVPQAIGIDKLLKWKERPFVKGFFEDRKRLARSAEANLSELLGAACSACDDALLAADFLAAQDGFEEGSFVQFRGFSFLRLADVIWIGEHLAVEGFRAK